MINTIVSAVIPVRNRSGVRLQNCLRSLRWQDLDPQKVEIVISDFGSDPHHLASINALAEEHGACVVETRTQAVWTRSKALNIGIQAAGSDVVFCTDADMIFQPNFLSSIVSVFQKNQGQLMALCRCHDLPQDIPEQLWNKEDYSKLMGQSVLRETSGTGACQVARRSFFLYSRGYDEKYVFWGAEDNDMLSRAVCAGLTVHWLNPGTSMLHQWHRTTKHDRKLLRFLNRWRFRLTKRTVLKNKHGWGQLK